MTGTGKSSRGRPPLDPDEPTVQTRVIVPAATYDRCNKIASRHGVSISRVVRIAVRRYLEDDERDDDD